MAKERRTGINLIFPFSYSAVVPITTASDASCISTETDEEATFFSSSNDALEDDSSGSGHAFGTGDAAMVIVCRRPSGSRI